VKRNAPFVVLSLVCLAALPAYAQFPGQGDDVIPSFGSFQIQVDKKLGSLFTGCPGYNSATNVFQSPTLSDPQARIGRSNAIKEGSPEDVSGVPVGADKTVIGSNSHAHTSAAKGTRKIHTEIRSLNMVSTSPGPPVRVRAGVWYGGAGRQSPPPPGSVSSGETKSQAGASDDPKKDFPAHSSFDVYAQIDLPACGSFPGGTFYNKAPVILKAEGLPAVPPKVVFLQDTSANGIPILALEDHGALWHKNQVVGCLVLAGNGVGVSSEEFANTMRRQHGGRCASAM
jgi:hypothetical protein